MEIFFIVLNAISMSIIYFPKMLCVVDNAYPISNNNYMFYFLKLVHENENKIINYTQVRNSNGNSFKNFQN